MGKKWTQATAHMSACIKAAESCVRLTPGLRLRAECPHNNKCGL
jgi:hypothetical protein